MQNLVIVESPTKAKTISKYLDNSYRVESCNGHIRDLNKSKKSIDISNNFKPLYEVNKNKKEIVKKLKKISNNSKTIFLASDDDREGESISWHLKETLKIKESKIKRIIFKEITKDSIKNAIENSRSINIDLVNSQQARRILDRIVGYELSPLLWKKTKIKLSTGRVQFAAIRLIVEKERLINSFISKSKFKVNVIFNLKNKYQIETELSENLESEDDSYKFINECKESSFVVKKIENFEIFRSPKPPFTTSTLQQESSIKLGYSLNKTMKLAQDLYEKGKISYIRTDSTALSEKTIDQIKKEIIKNHGISYFKKRIYQNKIANAQEAHESIRPTDLSKKKINESKDEDRLYNLIWKRTIGSQMSNSVINKKKITIIISNIKKILTFKEEITKFDGFLSLNNKIPNESSEKKKFTESLNLKDLLNLKEIIIEEIISKPSLRYTEGSLVKKMEEKGIGRPSTYAPTISKIQNKKYIIKESREGDDCLYKLIKFKNDKIHLETLNKKKWSEKNKLFPTDIAMIINDFLLSNFSKVTNLNFTTEIEKELDLIANGELKWYDMIKKFYKEFSIEIKKTKKNNDHFNKSRILGREPITNKIVIARIGKYGPIIQIGEKDEKIKFSKLKKNQLIENITLEESLNLFKFPKSLGEFDKKEILVNIGRYGPYIIYDDKFYKIEKSSIGKEEAILTIKERIELNNKKIIKSFEDKNIKILDGKWSPYIKFKNKNIKIPKNQDIDKMTLEDCLKIIKDAKIKL